MTEWMLLMLAGCAATVVGLVGCFVPVLPGPAVSYAALWLPGAVGYPLSKAQLAGGAALLVLVLVIDYVVPSLCAKRFKCSGWGVFGCFAGSVVGVFFLPIGIVLGPFVGTVVGELIAGKAIAESVRGGFGALLGYVVCLGIKLASVGVFAWWYFSRLPIPS